MTPSFSKLFIPEEAHPRAGWVKTARGENRDRKMKEKVIRRDTHRAALENRWDPIEEEIARQKAWNMHLMDPMSFLQGTD
jgi:hypothetical protein